MTQEHIDLSYASQQDAGQEQALVEEENPNHSITDASVPADQLQDEGVQPMGEAYDEEDEGQIGPDRKSVV